MYRIKVNGGCKLCRSKKSVWRKGSSREEVKTSAGGVEPEQTEFYCPNALDPTGKALVLSSANSSPQGK